MKNLFCILAASSAFALDNPSISKVEFRQNTPGTRNVTVTYTLADADAIVTMDVLVNGVSIGDKNITYLTGDVNKLVTTGDKTIVWNAGKSWPDQKFDNNEVVVELTAWPKHNPPDYMVADLEAENSVYYYTSADALPEGGLANDIYRKTKLVMRRIHAGGKTFTMGLAGDTRGNTPHTVEIADDYYIGIYPFTQKQWATMNNGERRSRFANDTCWEMRPVDRVTITELRETIANTAPASLYTGSPKTGSFLAMLGDKTGLSFDVPTEAQWEYACRAGHGDGYLGNGTAVNTENLSKMARWWGTNGSSDSADDNSDTSRGTAAVGAYGPNDWGLYDMLGNVQEWCLDSWTADISANTSGNPYLTETTQRVVRGGAWNRTLYWCNAAARSYAECSAPAGYYSGIFGFRVVAAINE